MQFVIVLPSFTKPDPSWAPTLLSLDGNYVTWQVNIFSASLWILMWSQNNIFLCRASSSNSLHEYQSKAVTQDSFHSPLTYSSSWPLWKVVWGTSWGPEHIRCELHRGYHIGAPLLCSVSQRRRQAGQVGVGEPLLRSIPSDRLAQMFKFPTPHLYFLSHLVSGADISWNAGNRWDILAHEPCPSKYVYIEHLFKNRDLVF